MQECLNLREKWLFRHALSPAQMDEREASCPSELFTANPFKWDDADPQVQVSGWVTAIHPPSSTKRLLEDAGKSVQLSHAHGFSNIVQSQTSRHFEEELRQTGDE